MFFQKVTISLPKSVMMLVGRSLSRPGYLTIFRLIDKYLTTILQQTLQQSAFPLLQKGVPS
jgi:hypothetical protein